jgi:hypothetical protein
MDASERWRILRLHVEDAIPLADLVRTTGVPRRTLGRWLARYRTGGYDALNDSVRPDRGIRRTPPDLVHLIEGLALTRPRPSIATIHRRLVEHCAGSGVQAPSYSTVQNIVHALDPGMVTLALDGSASYRDKHELLLRRRADRPNAVWQADHTMLDILIVGPDGKPARPWLSGWRASLTNLNDEIERQTTAMATAAADLPILLYRFRTAPTGGMGVGTVLNKLAETAEHVGEFTREFGEQNWVDMDEDETTDWRKTIKDLEAAAATFRRTVNLIS